MVGEPTMNIREMVVGELPNDADIETVRELLAGRAAQQPQ
jgi:hypothetical protein